MITLRKTVSLSLDINDINEAVHLFLKEKGFEAFDKVTLINLPEIMINGTLVLNAREINIDNGSEKNQADIPDKKTHITFPDSLISKIGRGAKGLEMFLYNVSADQVQLKIERSFLGLDNFEKQFLTFVFNLDQADPRENIVKNKQEIDEHYQSSTEPLGDVKKIIANLGKCTLNDFQVALSHNSLNPKYDLTNKEFSLKFKTKEFAFSCRTYNILRENDIETIEQLINLDHEKFKRMRNAGKISFQEIRNFIKLYKLDV